MRHSVNFGKTLDRGVMMLISGRSWKNTRYNQNHRWQNPMSTSSMSPLSVSREQAAAFRLARHHLVARAPAKDLLDVVRDMGGAQAQLFSAAQASIRSRVRLLRPEDLQQAVSRRRLVKASCMRRTLFLVPARDLAVFAYGSARRAEKEVRWARGKGVPEKVLTAAIEAALAALDEPLTRPEIAERVSRALGVQRRAIPGGGWGNQRAIAAVPVGHLTYPVVDLLHLAGARGVVCYGLPRGSEPTFVRADAWIPRWREMPADQAESRLLHMYLRAFGPATAADFSLWSGMTLREARVIWERERDALARVELAGQSATVLREDLDDLARARLDDPVVRLLPHFDSFLLGHRERDHLVDARHRAAIYRPQGWISPVLLVNGRVAGIWERAVEGECLSLSVTKFGPLPRRVTAGIREEAQDLARFLGAADVKVKVR